MKLWFNPIEENWRGEKNHLARAGQDVTLKPFGPNSPRLCTATITDIDEAAQTVSLIDSHRKLTITFDDWRWMKAVPIIMNDAYRMDRKNNPSHYNR